jgi:hypothetical protein
MGDREIGAGPSALIVVLSHTETFATHSDLHQTTAFLFSSKSSFYQIDQKSITDQGKMG